MGKPQTSYYDSITDRARQTAGRKGILLLRPPEPVGVKEHFDQFAGLVPWSGAASSAASAAATRLGAAPDDALYNTLRTQAADELALGGELSGDEIRTLDQGTRAGFSSRGMVRGPAAGFAEVLRRVAATNARKRERQGFAADIYGLGEKRRELDAGVLQATGGLAHTGNEFLENIRRFGIMRDDALTTDENEWNQTMLTQGKAAAAARNASRLGMVGNLLGGGLKLLSGGLFS